MQAQIQELAQTKNAVSVPVFSAVVCTNPSATMNESLSFTAFEIEAKKEYGDFDLKTGFFTVKKPGTFQFNFTGLAQMKGRSRSHHLELLVDGFWKSMSFVNMESSDGYQPVVLSALQQLVTGQKVSVVIRHGELFDNLKTRATRFSCVFFS